MSPRVARVLTILAFVNLGAVAWGAGRGEWPLVVLGGAAIIVAVMPRRAPAPRPLPYAASARARRPATPRRTGR